MLGILTKIFDSNEKQLKKIQPIIDKINNLEGDISTLSSEELKNKTIEFRKRLEVDISTARIDLKTFKDISKESKKSDLNNEQNQLTDILPEAFAVVREASRRVTNHRHFDVQLLAGYFLFTNKVTEVFTGEGKTLSANLPLYLYGLTGKGAHLVTVNEYLARRDAEWNGHILNSLGLTVGVINSGSQYKYISDEDAIRLKGDDAKKLIDERESKVKEAGRMKYDHMSGVNLIECSKKEAYECDVVYGTNNEFGFDYLRDNMVGSLEERVQGPLHFAIVDEADSILIDEARTPLIISQSADESNDQYRQFAEVVRNLEAEQDFTVDEKAHAVSLTEEGVDKVEKLLGVENVYESAQLAYHLENALKAQELYKLDDEYIIRNGEVLIVDEFTGRVLSGRRYSEGLHQAIEAKEGVEVKRESRTLATITLQNYFRLYDFLSGMTGTALTEAEEFANIYKLDTMVIPTDKPVQRIDENDIVYRTQDGKFKAIVTDIAERYEKGQPVLVGTTSVEKSETLSEMLNKQGITHNVLNAKFHEMEAKIVASAGQKSQITIATNMAGRGTDIALGEGVRELGGLYVIGSERHESRRIDNQLRGRSGRQGDPGRSRFYVSFEDELMRLFGGDSMKGILGQVGMDDEMPISMGLLGRTIESAQKKVEAHNYDIRKQLVEYDDVLNQQREIIYGLRRKLLSVSKRINDELSSNDKGQDNPSLDAKKLRDMNIEDLLSQVDAFSLRDDRLWEVDGFKDYEIHNNPMIIWIFKKIVDYVRYVVSVQLSDDMNIDNTEERKVVAQIKALLGEELADISAKTLGYADSLELFKSFDKTQSIVEKENDLMRLVVTAFLFHVLMLGKLQTTELVKYLALQSMDSLWMEHLDTMSDLREGISLRNIAQRDPLVEYKNEGFKLFDDMMANIDSSMVGRFFRVSIVQKQEINTKDVDAVKVEPNSSLLTDGISVEADNRPGKVGRQATKIRQMKKVGRNDPCPCGSGKKYKKCHGKGV